MRSAKISRRAKRDSNFTARGKALARGTRKINSSIINSSISASFIQRKNARCAVRVEVGKTEGTSFLSLRQTF